jgi:hypothetical protein
MLFLIFIMRINRKKEFGFLITYDSTFGSSLRPLRLCVKKILDNTGS